MEMKEVMLVEHQVIPNSENARDEPQTSSCPSTHNSTLPQTLVVGSNYTFGRGAMGTVETLREQSAQMGFGLDVIPPILWAGEMVSSTRIRQLLTAGYPAEAEMMAGHALIGAMKRED